MLTEIILWIVLLWTTTALCDLCTEKDPKTLSCEDIDVSSLVTAEAKVTVSIEINVCHEPVDLTFTVQDTTNKWKWIHTFVNEDEIQEVKGSPAYLLLRVKVQEVGNSTIHVQGHFVVVGEGKPLFLDHVFTVDNSTDCPVFEKQTGRAVTTLLPLIVFIVLCCLILITGVALLIWFQVRRKSRQQTHTYSGSRPVSSVYSYEEEDYVDKATAAAIAAKKKVRQTGQSKTTTAVIRNSIYRESLLIDDVDVGTNPTVPYVSYTTEDDVKYSSLPRHFGGRHAYWPPSGGNDDDNNDHGDWNSAQNNFVSRTLPRRVSESPDIPTRQIPAKEYLGIHSGSSRPHYSATLFQSFRGGGGGGGSKNSGQNDNKVARRKTTRGPLSAQTRLLDKNYTSSASNTPSPQGSCSQVTNGNNNNSEGHRKRATGSKGQQDAGKRLSAVRLLHDHDEIPDHEDEEDYRSEPTDRDLLRSSRY